MVVTVLFLISTYLVFHLYDLGSALNQAAFLSKKQGIGCFNLIGMASSAAGLLNALGVLWGSAAFMTLLFAAPAVFVAMRLAYVRATIHKPVNHDTVALVGSAFIAAFCLMVWINVALCVAQFIWGVRLV